MNKQTLTHPTYKKYDWVYPRAIFAHLYPYFESGPRQVIRIMATPNLSYEKQFVYVMVNGEEMGFYAKALQLKKPSPKK